VLLQRQDDFESAAKELTEAVAQQEEEDNLVLSFATAADSDYIAYVYAQVLHKWNADGDSWTCLCCTDSAPAVQAPQRDSDSVWQQTLLAMWCSGRPGRALRSI
jgi:hypothetical protein